MENEQRCLKSDVYMRQALTIGSLLNLTGLILAFTIDTRFIVLSILVSGGLLVSGMFGWCPMAYFLAKLPFNKN
ncbi:DUF2892 domain-containing protein [Candidatus Nomurabacteria bacterium]|nr:DUF2892 domain-containing protein [Candidatus Kaiserbacteria bacterium]MCB9814481.1 DUF2892 domain-containing protein [Candidatus Nomurabacteria bacterium]